MDGFVEFVIESRSAGISFESFYGDVVCRTDSDGLGLDVELLGFFCELFLDLTLFSPENPLCTMLCPSVLQSGGPKLFLQKRSNQAN